jgi:hypothetical protein
MKFDKLFKIITEAKNEQPGNRFFNVQNREGPASYVSGPIGKSDNFELPTFTENLVKDIGSAMGSKWYNTMFTSFGLLANDETFKTNFNKISDNFGRRRASYNHTKTITDYETGEEEKIKYDYEKKLDNLEFMKAKRAAQVTELNDRKRHFEKRINDWQKFKNSPLQKNRLKQVYVGVKATVEEIEKQNKKSKNNHFFEIKEIYDDIKKKNDSIDKLTHNLLLTKSVKNQQQIQKDIDMLNNDITKLIKNLNSKKYSKQLPEFKKYRKYLNTMNNVEDKYINSELDESIINRDSKTVLDLTSSIKEMEDKFQEVVNELEENYDYIDQINEVNQEADQDAQAGFIHLVKTTAERLLNEFKVQMTAITPDIVDWGTLPKSNLQKFNVLKTLTSEDSNINPMIWYLNAFQNSYDNREYDSSRQMDSKTNITSIRDFERLPFSIMMKIYKGVYSKPISLQAKEYDETKSNSWDILSEYLQAFKGMKGDELFEPFVSRKLKSPETQSMIPILSGLKVRDVWSNVKSKDFIKKLINETGLPESFKNRHILAVSSPRPMSSSRTGANSFWQLWSSIDADIRSTKVKKESFDKVFERFINERIWNDDDFKLNTMEMLSLVNKSK